MVECFSFNPSSCKFNFCYCFSFFFWGMNQSWDTSCSKNRLHCLDISHLSFARVCIPLFYGIDPIYRPQGSFPSSVVSFLYFFFPTQTEFCLFLAGLCHQIYLMVFTYVLLVSFCFYDLHSCK